MGNAKIWYYPDPANVVREIDLGTGLSDLTEGMDAVADVAEDIQGDQARQLWRHRLKVRILLERFSSASLARSLLTLRSHLLGGGSIGLAADSAKAWAGFTLATPRSDDTVMATRGNVASSWSGSAALANGDEVVISGLQPAPIYEWSTVSSQSSGRVTLATGLRYQHTTVAMVRHRNFFPALMLPSDVTSIDVAIPDRRTTWTLDLELVEDVAAIAALSEVEAGGLRGTTAGPGKVSLDGFVGAAKSASTWSLPAGLRGGSRGGL